MKKSVAVLGLGKFGSSIARSLAKGGAEVLAVDKDEDLVRDIADKVTCAVCVDISDKEMMNNIGLEGMDAVVIAAAMEKAVETAYKAVMKPKEGTILTVAKGMAEKAVDLATQTDDVIDFLTQVIEEGDYVLSQTPEMLPVLNRLALSIPADRDLCRS